MDLVRADRFTIKELTDAYNLTRVDYIVPMPMSIARLLDYISLYDVDLSASWVAIKGQQFLGLGMLGLRQDRAWITRLGVLPEGRRQGIGRSIMDKLLASAAHANIPVVWLEVIKGNEPANNLFKSSGFSATRELLVARRPPDPAADVNDLPGQPSKNRVRIHRWDEAREFLVKRQNRPNWLNETESLLNIDDLLCLSVELPDGGFGWICYRVYMFQIINIVLHVVHGQPIEVATAILKALHRRHPMLDAVLENIAFDDPLWQAYEQVGYFDAFKRIEMVNHLAL